MKYKNITLLGTSHIAKQSVEEVEQHIKTHQPDIVGVELDRNRLHALLQKGKRRMPLRMIFSIGVKGFVFALMGQYVQNKLGNAVGVKPGADMLAAVKTARKQGCDVYLIDQDVQVTLAKFSQAITWKEKWRFFVDILYALFFREKAMERYGINTFDLTKVPPKKIIKQLTGRVKERFPNVYRVIIEERNHIMAKKLVKLSKDHPDKDILGVIGAGHEEDMITLMKKYDK